MANRQGSFLTAIDVGSAKTVALMVEMTDGGLRYRGHALALAICHCWRAPMIARMAAAEALAAQQRHAYTAKLAAKAKAAKVKAAR